MIWRILGTLVGLALLIVGIPLTISPIPLGIVIVAIGVVILVASNPLAASILKRLRAKYPWLNRFFRKAEDVLPDELADALDKTEDKSDLDEPAEAPGQKLGPPMQRRNIPRPRR